MFAELAIGSERVPLFYSHLKTFLDEMLSFVDELGCCCKTCKWLYIIRPELFLASWYFYEPHFLRRWFISCLSTCLGHRGTVQSGVSAAATLATAAAEHQSSAVSCRCRHTETTDCEPDCRVSAGPRHRNIYQRCVLRLARPGSAWHLFGGCATDDRDAPIVCANPTFSGGEARV